MVDHAAHTRNRNLVAKLIGLVLDAPGTGVTVASRCDNILSIDVEEAGAATRYHVVVSRSRYQPAEDLRPA